MYDFKAFLDQEIGPSWMRPSSPQVAALRDATLGHLLLELNRAKPPRRISFNTALLEWDEVTDVITVGHDLELDKAFTLPRVQFLRVVRQAVADSLE